MRKHSKTLIVGLVAMVGIACWMLLRESGSVTVGSLGGKPASKTQSTTNAGLVDAQLIETHIASNSGLPRIVSTNYAADTITITRIWFTNIIWSADQDYAWRGWGNTAGAACYMLEDLVFGSNSAVTLSQIFDRYVHDNPKLYDAFRYLRFKALVPIARDTIASWNTNQNPRIILRARNLLDLLDHPDSIRAIISLDKVIPDDSPLRQSEYKPAWMSGLDPSPVYRNDCLDVYIDVMRHPQDYKADMWMSCISMVAKFTTDVAVAELRKASDVGKHPEKYWPRRDSGELRGDRMLYSACVRLQKDRVDGKELIPYRVPPPMLDE